jgi:hypothetical protein
MKKEQITSGTIGNQNKQIIETKNPALKSLVNG